MKKKISSLKKMELENSTDAIHLLDEIEGRVNEVEEFDITDSLEKNMLDWGFGIGVIICKFPEHSRRAHKLFSRLADLAH